jgi:hypothetical protein
VWSEEEEVNTFTFFFMNSFVFFQSI